jgi:lipid-A-disaccharide synthase
VARTIYFVAGEASGDEHGAALMRSLRDLSPDLKFVGRGGARMELVAGENFTNWSDAAAIVGLWEVIKHYGYFRKQFRATLAEIAQQRPDAVVLIDYPGFNLRLARTLRRRFPALKIIYYISPQVWAWNRGRIPRMAEWLDLMLCIFPFEAELYNESGLRTLFVGHPMIENLRADKIDSQREEDLVGLFPGSRRREVRKILPIMLEAARELLRNRESLHFEISAASKPLAVEIEHMLEAAHLPEKHFLIVTGDAPSLMQRAFAGIVASGTATLEAAAFRMPFVLVYKVAWSTYFAARLVVKVKYLGMPNVLAEKEIVPEFIQGRAKPAAIAQATLQLMNDQEARRVMISQFVSIVAKLGEGGASKRAADAIVKELTQAR